MLFFKAESCRVLIWPPLLILLLIIVLEVSTLTAHTYVLPQVPTMGQVSYQASCCKTVLNLSFLAQALKLCAYFKGKKKRLTVLLTTHPEPHGR